MIDLAGKVALVSGGSRGIGAACCALLGRAGARVAVGYRSDRTAAGRVVAQIEAGGGEALALAGDLAEPSVAASWVEATVERWGRLDVLVNNAGIWNRAPIEELDDERLREMLETNVAAVFRLIRAAVGPLRRGGGGCIVNVSSTAGQRGEAHHSHYAASKGALISLTKSLAVELAGDGIRTNCVAPGWVETDMTREALAGEAGRRIGETIPLGRAGRAEEVAGAVLFLASGLAGYVNGEVLNVNGGSVLCG
jgi:3-oxoacyl-[acyl-carrier protein] reductase